MSARFPYSPARVPPVPAVVVTLLSPDGSRAIPRVSAHLDTAADQTVVPTALLHQLGLRPVGRLSARGFGGGLHAIDVYDLGIDVFGVGTIPIRALSHPAEPFVLIGRDILNQFRVTVDGPNQVVEFH